MCRMELYLSIPADTDSTRNIVLQQFNQAKTSVHNSIAVLRAREQRTEISRLLANVLDYKNSELEVFARTQTENR